MSRSFRSLIAVFALLLPLSSFATEAINTLGTDGSLFHDPTPTGVAIRGTDTVAYFTEHKAVTGKDEFTTEWKGARWKFSSKENLEKFKTDPAKYAPQYGGYCAYGTANGHLVKIEPDQFTIRDGKLYLNYDADVQKKWSKDPQGNIKKADANFESLLKK